MRGLFHEPIGVDFSTSFAAGLRSRLADMPPEAMARVTLLVNTTRMARRIEAALVADGPTLLPRIGLVSDVSMLLPPGQTPVAEISPLALRLKLTELVAKLLEADPSLAPVAASFDLASSLSRLLAEIEEEAMEPEALHQIETGDLSAHWQRTLKFLQIATDWMGADGRLTPAGAKMLALQRLFEHWAAHPPQDPVIVAGSTASRTPTRRLIHATLGLPQGVVVLPGLDRDMPPDAWNSLTAGTGPGQQDHPQYRHAALLGGLGLTNTSVPQWGPARPAAPSRNALVSLALRPAPVTDAWRSEGPDLPDIDAACAGVTLVEAPSPGSEAAAIALGLRAALEAGKTAALITPDRTLSRQVAAQLDRWRIVADDSAGRPLNQSAPGRLLLHTADLRGKQPDAEELVILLKHPLTHSGGDRVDHLKQARALEIGLLRDGPCAFPTRLAVEAWVAQEKTPVHPGPWTDWLCDLLDALPAEPEQAPLSVHLARHRALIDAVVQGTGDNPDAMWSDAAGRVAGRVLDDLAEAAPDRGANDISSHDYARLLSAILSGEEVRETYSPHPGVMIWGALEARVRSADIVILGGLNDDVWPGQPAPDPWLNRAMRSAAGLHLPDRAVGLSAHDFQQAASGREVWLTRALRGAETETVPSRWMNRLVGLLGGIGPTGADALARMRARGGAWLTQAAALDKPLAVTDRAPRPAPILPRGVTLDRLSVTGAETLIRDPYAIYARQILRLRALNPLRQGPDARERGSAIHDAMEAFTRRTLDGLPPDAPDLLRTAVQTALEETAPWPGAQRLWLGKFERVIEDFLAAEVARREIGKPIYLEETGELVLSDPPFTLTARADRIDDRGDSLAIFDYKTGKAPSGTQQKFFAKQLLLEAIMIMDGAFPNIPARPVSEAGYLSMGSTYAEKQADDFGPELIAQTRDRFRDLIRGYQTGRPFLARLAPDMISHPSDYDHLSRRGEWDDTQAAERIKVGRHD